MDILTHTLSGIALGSIIGIRTKSIKPLAFGALGGVLPDVDAISLWSKFDDTIGRWCNLNHSGHEIYFGKFWYSHHAVMHSLVAAFSIGLIIHCIAYFISKSKNAYAYNFAFTGGFIMHLLGDLPTPGSTWDGVNLFWPSTSYVGGTGDIWWWNNYDVFLITLTAVVINTLILFFQKFWSKKYYMKIGFVVFVIGFLLSVYQIKSRKYDFDYEGFSTDFGTKEQKSLEIQQEILGDKLFHYMQVFDSRTGINF